MEKGPASFVLTLLGTNGPQKRCPILGGYPNGAPHRLFHALYSSGS